MITITLAVIALSLIAYLVKKAWDINQHWEKKGIKHCKPVLFFGNCFPIVLNKKSLSDIIGELYNKYPKEQVLGFYDFLTPRLFIRDPELLQKILIKDFTHFTDHGFEINSETNPTDDQLFVMNGSRWRAFRNKMSPIFTSGKLKDMYTTMSSCGENLIEYLKKRENEDIDIRELMGLFSMDVIGAAVFGMDPGTLKNPDCEFRVMGKRLTETNFQNILRFWLLLAFPKFFQKLGISFQDNIVNTYYGKLIQQNFEYRKEKQVYRNDFTQMLLQLKEKGKVEVQSWDSNDDYLKTNEPVGSIEQYEITDNIILAQAQSFMVAGFETTAILLAFTLFELTQNPEMQEKVREEIFEQTKHHGGFTYEALKNMKYLEATIKETQRLYPMVAYLFRACTKDYELPDGYVIKKGDHIAIPVSAVHLDPNNYPDPKVYRPERFLEPIKQGIYLPFGEGPRICIAMRYAIMVMKYGLAKFLMHYRAKLSEKTKVPLQYNYRFFTPVPSNKIMLKIEKI